MKRRKRQPRLQKLATMTPSASPDEDAATLIQRLAERKAEGLAFPQARLAEIQAKMTPEWQAEMRGRIAALNAMAAAPRSKLPKLYALMEVVGELRAPHLACNAGCSFCCKTIPVEISDLEANLIASVTGRQPAKLPPGRHTIPGDAPGRVNTPCPFLKDDLCSIYAHRPYSCRSLGVVDRDSLTCHPENTTLARAKDPRAVPVSMTKMQAFDPTYQELHRRPGTAWADIRQFFPER